MQILKGKKSELLQEKENGILMYYIKSLKGKILYKISNKFIGANKEALYQFLRFEDQKKPSLKVFYK